MARIEPPYDEFILRIIRRKGRARPVHYMTIISELDKGYSEGNKFPSQWVRKILPLLRELTTKGTISSNGRGNLYFSINRGKVVLPATPPPTNDEPFESLGYNWIEVENLKRTLEGVNQTLSSRVLNIEEREIELANLNQEQSVLQGELQELDKEYNDLRKQEREINSRISKLKKECNALINEKEQLVALTSQRKDEEERNATRLKDTRQQVTSIEHEIDTTRSEIEKYHSEIDAVKEELKYVTEKASAKREMDIGALDEKLRISFEELKRQSEAKLVGFKKNENCVAGRIQILREQNQEIYKKLSSIYVNIENIATVLGSS